MDADQTSQPYAEVLVNGHPIDFHVDTGADVSVISEKDYTAKAPRPPLTSLTTKLVSASNDSMAVVGAFTATMECSRHER